MPAALPVALVIDDEAQIRRAVKNALAPDFARVLESGTGKDAIDLAAAQRPALVVLDLGLPDMSGADVCHALRHRIDAPIVVLAARHTDIERVALLDAGADDYVTKPFTPEEFQARVRALMRRSPYGEHDTSRIQFGTCVLDVEARTLTRDGVSVHLTPIEWALLRLLASNAGKVLTHQQLFTSVWRNRKKYGDAQQYLRVHVANLRRKIEDDSLHPCYILTESGVGYRFDPVP